MVVSGHLYSRVGKGTAAFNFIPHYYHRHRPATCSCIQSEDKGVLAIRSVPRCTMWLPADMFRRIRQEIEVEDIMTTGHVCAVISEANLHVQICYSS